MRHTMTSVRSPMIHVPTGTECRRINSHWVLLWQEKLKLSIIWLWTRRWTMVVVQGPVQWGVQYYYP